VLLVGDHSCNVAWETVFRAKLRLSAAQSTSNVIWIQPLRRFEAGRDIDEGLYRVQRYVTSRAKTCSCYARAHNHTDANDNSEAQVEALVREFQAFALCLHELDDLMKDFGKPLPFPVEDFKSTLQRCDASLKPYKENLVDRKMDSKKFWYTVKYIGKEKELDGLRKQISGHFQVLNMCLSFLQL
jgi:hypothetical protein